MRRRQTAAQRLCANTSPSGVPPGMPLAPLLFSLPGVFSREEARILFHCRRRRPDDGSTEARTTGPARRCVRVAAVFGEQHVRRRGLVIALPSGSSCCRSDPSQRGKNASQTKPTCVLKGHGNRWAFHRCLCGKRLTLALTDGHGDDTAIKVFYGSVQSDAVCKRPIASKRLSESRSKPE